MHHNNDLFLDTTRRQGDEKIILEGQHEGKMYNMKEKTMSTLNLATRFFFLPSVWGFLRTI